MKRFVFMSWITILVMASSCLILTGGSEAKIDPQTILGMWLFDEEGGDVVKDSSGNRNDGTLEGRPKPKRVKGQFGKALDFDGEQSRAFVEIMNNPSLDVTTALSLHYWIKIEKYVSAGVVTKHRQNNPNIEGWHSQALKAHFREESLKISFQLRPDGKCCRGLESTVRLPQDAWHHVVATYDNTNMRLYINGVEDESSPVAATGKINGTQNINIGRDVNTEASYFAGVIDEVAVFNVALTQEDVRRLSSGLLAAMAVQPERKLAVTWGRIKAKASQ